MEDTKTEALRNYKQPRTKRDVRSFLGLAGYYRKFVPGFAELTAQLSDLTAKGQPDRVVWTKELQRDFDELKRLMSMEPILRCPDEQKEFILQTDASERGIAAVLSQMDEEGVDRPVAYYSRKLLARERRYSAVEKECLAVVNAVKHFEVHLIGRKFSVVTDHRALSYLQSMQNANGRLTRWALVLQPFNFHVQHRPGRLNGNADGLSRQAWMEDEDHKEEELQRTHCSAAGEEGGGVREPQKVTLLRC